MNADGIHFRRLLTYARLSACICGCILLLATVASGQPSLRRYETAHYNIHTDVSDELARDLCRRMDTMYEEYAKRLVEFAPPRGGPKFEVYIYANRADYEKFLGNRMPNSGGIFVAAKNTLAATLGGQGRDALRRTLQHEAFHQFAFTAIGPNLPLWLNEGLAVVFEEGIFNGEQFLLGQVPPRRLRQLQADISQADSASRKLIDFRQFLKINSEEWQKNMTDVGTAATQYNQAWAMTHFLVFATDSNGNFKFRTRLIDMLRAVHRGTDGMDAFKGAFGENIDGFQRRFIEYAATLSATPQATYIEHQDVLADLLVELKARGQRFSSIDSFREALVKNGYYMQYTKANVRWSTGKDIKAYFADLDGRPFDAAHLYLDMRVDAPIGDMICRPMDGLQLRTRFINADDKCEHEILAEPD